LFLIGPKATKKEKAKVVAALKKAAKPTSRRPAGTGAGPRPSRLIAMGLS